MALPISPNTRSAAAKIIKEPNLVLCIDGFDKCFGSGIVREVIRIGEPDLYIDGSWVIGGIRILEDQITAVSIDGSSTTIRQQLDAEKARGSSVQSMEIELVDLNGQVTELITPGLLIDDVLGKKATVYLAMDNATAVWPDDYEILFKGNIDDIKTFAASITFNIAHPEQKKKQVIWPRVETQLAAPITNSDTTITLVSTTDFLLPVPGPDLSIDPNFQTYVTIEDEVIRYTGISGVQLTGCSRAQLGTQALSHAAGKQVNTFIRLTGDVMSIALKLMLSREDYFLTGLEFSNFNVHQAPTSIANTIYFEGFNAQRIYGYSIGDYLSVSGSANPGTNDVTLKPILSVGTTEYGSYIEVGGVSFVDEVGTSATVSFRSKYDVWPAAMGMGGDEVDVFQHEAILQTYLSGFAYDIYIKDTIEDAREFLEQEIYKPASCYSVPRKAKSSVQIIQSPIPSANVKTLNASNIIDPSKIRMRRTINKQFANTIVYKFDEDPITDKYLKGTVQVSATSLNQIKVGSKALVVESKGLRSSANGIAQAQQAGLRKLNRYQFGAEHFDGVKTTFGNGFDIEVGDVIIFDGANLHLANTADGSRDRPAQLVEVQNKTLNYKTGEVTVDLVATGYSGSGKYCLVGASSQIKSGIDQQTFVIEQFFRSIYGSAEYQKWVRYTKPAVVVRSPDSVTRYAITVLEVATSNTVVVRDLLGFVPQAGDIMELAPHDYVDVTDQIKLVYGHMSPLDGGAVDPYQMI